MFNKFINQLKDNKKPTAPSNEQSIMKPVEDFFSRVGFEIESEVWKMSASQLEKAYEKQEKYIKHLKKLYKTQYDELNPVLLRHLEYCSKERQQLIEKINQPNQSESILLQPDKVEIQQKPEEDLLSLQIPVQQVVLEQNLIDLESQRTISNSEYYKMKEEIERLQNQCAQVCEEMRRLTEDNDDLEQALETEKAYRISQNAQKNAEIDELTQLKSQLEERVKELSLSIEENQGKQAQLLKQVQQFEEQEQSKYLQDQESRIKLSSQQEELILNQKQAENRLIQEQLKVDNLKKDLERVTEEIEAKNKELESVFAIKQNLEQMNLTLRNKRKKDKAFLQTHYSEYQQLQEENLYLLNELKKQTEKPPEVANPTDSTEKIRQLTEQIEELEFKLQEKVLNEESLEQQLKESKHYQSLLKEEISQFETNLSDQQSKCEELSQLLKSLQGKREFALQEILQLTNTIEKLQRSQVRPSATPDFQSIKKKKKTVILTTLKKVGQDVRKQLQIAYADFINTLLSLHAMINQHEGIKALHTQFIQVEKKINDCNRRAQDFLDLFEDIGFK